MNRVLNTQRQACQQARPFTAKPPRRCRLTVMNSQAGGDVRGSKMEKGLFGENFGARDPFAGELATNFGENVLGNYNTEHIIKPPDNIKRVLGLSSRSCKDNLASLTVLSGEDRELLRNQVPGWRMATLPGAGGKPCIQQSWKLKDEAAAEQMVERVTGVAAAEGHGDSLTMNRVGTEVVAMLCTASLGGLTENDFIVASKVNDLNIVDLLPKRKPRFWA
ncbi:hypothetical protein VOLCADRAFT_109679 [Volvox carteri f. nagariensis]|uniref:4a-hydroxytetrahydrobiopterin dehydratase n=1 Tax=Volvox carteri f. nagariensis TaxID=3068 RepID=D8TQG0_VOLCA|nr:uncharacterized protein VOLCADRAFT_109679 [Volvox carteri f. nagariensis]EFJ50527.1 hypothetical protein VOLCADRAFT_109679 [Volvox carteri f. nagariensis]|eukprot:XP_002948652.1 hypothetical protein VOLCADRAFT_109679 [Volvox carteri f. nagariensis]